MRYPDRATVCVSSQAGCAMGCTFCATGQAGFTRHLSTGEIVEQVVAARRAAAPGRACPTWCSWAWASRSPTTTGSGRPSSGSTTTGPVRPPPDRLHRRRRSRHPPAGPRSAPGQPGRVPARGQRPPAQQPGPAQPPLPAGVLMEACRQYLAAKGRRLSFEWALIAGVNDRPSDAARAGRAGPAPRRPRQPDPAQPDPRLPGPGHRAGRGPRLPGPLVRTGRQRHGAAQPRAPTSTPPADSWRPGPVAPVAPPVATSAASVRCAKLMPCRPTAGSTGPNRRR